MELTLAGLDVSCGRGAGHVIPWHVFLSYELEEGCSVALMKLMASEPIVYPVMRIYCGICLGS